ncbi:MAG: hypothetical protein HWE22_01090 [Flavobacteriales bacterium]|nr:hypothetical protein [Flavobacteriales bacterium]
MNGILDSNLSSHELIELVEEYIAKKRENAPIETAQFRQRIRKLGYSEDQTQDILIEIDDDADKELLAGIGIKRAKQRLVSSLIIGFAGIAFSIAGALGLFSFGTGILIVPFGIVGAAFIAAGKAYAEIGLVEKRKKRRRLKYDGWN